MDSINALNHFQAYMTPQHNKVSAPAVRMDNGPVAAADGFEHCSAGGDAVMSQTDALKFLSTAETKAAASVSEVQPAARDFGFELNGISSSSIVYLGI